MTPDFSELPDVVWVNILSFLKLHDRAKVSETCQMLNSTFNHPSVWHTVSLLCDRSIDSKTDTIDMPRKCLEIINRFGKYFQALNITFFEYMSKSLDTRHVVLKNLATECKLDSLTINIQLAFRKHIDKNKADLEGVIYLIQNSSKLKSLDIIHWPLHQTIQVPNLLEIMQGNARLVSLEFLCLFWNGTSSSNWETLNTLMPTAEETLSTVTMLRNLTSLKLRSSMINTELIDALAKRKLVPLRKLSILITYSRLDSDRHIPDIEASSWSGLVKQSPGLAVEFTVLNRVPVHELLIILKEGIPVTSVQFLKYSDCKEAILYHVISAYGLTLQKFKDFGFPSIPMDNAVLKLISSCPELCYFVFNGKLHYSTVAYIAKVKGPEWCCFQVNSENIITTEPQEDNDDDVLLKKNKDGSVDILRAPEMLQSDIERQGILEVMIQEVAEYLGVRWLPMDYIEKPQS